MISKTEINYPRKCLVCDSTFMCKPNGDIRRHHCVSMGELAIRAELPPECWQKQNMPFAADLLATIQPRQLHTKGAKKANARSVSLARDILAEVSKETESEINLEAISEKYGLKYLKKFCDLLPETSALRNLVKPEIDRMESDLKEKGKRPKAPPLPAELERGVQLYAEASNRRMKLKIKNGHNYSADTVRRRIDFANKFSQYLAKQEIQFWAEVSQRHLNSYLNESNRTAAQQAYTFLMFLRRHFRMMQKFVRPKNKKIPPDEAVFNPRQVKDIVARVVQHDDEEVIVAALFILLYAQTCVRCAQLRLDNFCRKDGKLMVLFAEQWIALDKLTEKFLCKFRPEIEDPDFEPSNQLLFNYSEKNLARYLRDLLDAPMKKLRLAAVANVIRSGVADRVSINRILGVSLPTIAYLEATFHWDLQSSIPKEMVDARNEVFRGERRE